MKEIDPQHLLVKISKILKKLDIPYFVTGGMAVLVWGRPRFTADIDIIIGLKTTKVNDLEEALSKLGKAVYIDKDSIQRALSNYGEFNFIDSQTGLKVDFFIMKNTQWDSSCLKRVISKKILGKNVNFISAEDLILSKLLWYKKSWSLRHIEDIESVIKISKTDKNYIRNWIIKLNLDELLDKIILQGYLKELK